MGYYQLCLVGRYRSRRNLNFCSSPTYLDKDGECLVNRSAEAMTIFAVVQAGIFPVIHMGRVWVGYWVFPLPNQFGCLLGLTLTRRYFGTYLQFQLISLYLPYSGLRD